MIERLTSISFRRVGSIIANGRRAVGRRRSSASCQRPRPRRRAPSTARLTRFGRRSVRASLAPRPSQRRSPTRPPRDPRQSQCAGEVNHAIEMLAARPESIGPGAGRRPLLHPVERSRGHADPRAGRPDRRDGGPQPVGRCRVGIRGAALYAFVPVVGEGPEVARDKLIGFRRKLKKALNKALNTYAPKWLPSLRDNRVPTVQDGRPRTTAAAA